ncbi:NTPase [Paraburkholderia tropica]|nr:NTPase [Paraburkholderia tropica]
MFAIRGGWGFGKSSLKNLVTERLEAGSERAEWLDFNPWQWGDGDAIARALFAQIADRLGGPHSTAAIDRAAALRRYGAILTGASDRLKDGGTVSDVIAKGLTNVSVIAVASAVGFDLPAVATVAGVLAFLSFAFPLLGRLLAYLGHDRSGESLDKVREALEVSLRKLKRPLVIFVDDIDRLEPDQIRVLLRQVKANANLPNLVFVLLFQRSIVESALDPVANNDGRAFLEKIVQANFDLPATPVSIVHRIFGEELSGLAGAFATETNGFTPTRWGNAFAGCIQPLLRNLRDARRLISSIAVHLPLHVDGDVLEVNIVDFLVLEAFRAFEPDLHAALFRERELVVQERRFQGDHRQDVERAAAQGLLDLVPAPRRDVAKDALKELFPPLEWAFGGANYGDGFRERWLREKRVCTSRYFARYFELQTAVGELSERRFIAFLEASATEDQLDGAIAGIEADGLLPSLVARFDESVDRLPVEHAEVLLPGMFRIAEKLAGTQDGDPFSSPWISAWRATSGFLKRLPEDIRGHRALAALRQTGALSVAAILIHLSDPADRREEEQANFDPALDPGAVEALKVEWLRLVRERALNGDALLEDSGLMSLLYRWRDYAGLPDEPREWVALQIRTDEGFARMAARMMSRGTRYSAGDRVSTPHNHFNRETIEDFIGIGVAKARCDAIDFAGFPEQEEALRTLARSLDIWLGLSARDPHDF